jgi:decaprenylphospho-beta-D-erythro-pentofuranosid-2-ulose 2-reductase
MSKGTVLILGARSDMAMAIAHCFAKEGYDIQLAARNADGLASDTSDIVLRYQVAVTQHEFDALNTESHGAFVEHLPVLPDIAVCAVGYMGEQAENERGTQAASLVMRSNYEGPASILAVLANHLEERGTGCLVGISSVAGERGRATNYIYGSAKAGLTAFLSGLRNRLAKKGVHVVTVLPGFVATKMTEGMYLPTKLTAQPEEVADAVLKAALKKQNVIYVKPIWRLIMMIIRNIPEQVFKGMKI